MIRRTALLISTALAVLGVPATAFAVPLPQPFPDRGVPGAGTHVEAPVIVERLVTTSSMEPWHVAAIAAGAGIAAALVVLALVQLVRSMSRSHPKTA